MNLNRFLILAVLLTLGFVSCRSHRTIDASKENTAPDALSKYEKQLGISLPASANREYFAAIAPWVGAPYKYGGNLITGTDCSGFVSTIYSNVFHIQLERTSASIYQKSRKITKKELREGDLLFFTIEGKKVSHVGMHLAGEYFIHASTKRGVVVSSMTEPYYIKTFTAYGTYR